MGRTTTPAYVVQIADGRYRYAGSAWVVATDGKPTEANLRRYVESFEASTRPGGANAHLGEVRVLRASIRRNVPAGQTVATYQAPAFEGGGLEA